MVRPSRRPVRRARARLAPPRLAVIAPPALAVRIAAAAAALALSATAAAAQVMELPTLADTLPACSDLGIRRVAVMVPPGQTTGELRALLAGGTLFPPATEALILQPAQLTELRTAEAFQERLGLTLERLSRWGLRIDGTLSTLLVLDADGGVREARPNTGHAEANTVLASLWKEARFAPYHHEGCRIPAWIHVPATFTSEGVAGSNRTVLRVGPPPPR